MVLKVFESVKISVFDSSCRTPWGYKHNIHLNIRSATAPIVIISVSGKNCRSRGREIPSNGENRWHVRGGAGVGRVFSHIFFFRLNCFVCDYDLCVDCVNKRGAVKISGIFKDDIDQPPSYFEATKNDNSIKT